MENMKLEKTKEIDIFIKNVIEVIREVTRRNKLSNNDINIKELENNIIRELKKYIPELKKEKSEEEIVCIDEVVLCFGKTAYNMLLSRILEECTTIKYIKMNKSSEKFYNWIGFNEEMLPVEAVYLYNNLKDVRQHLNYEKEKNKIENFIANNKNIKSDILLINRLNKNNNMPILLLSFDSADKGTFAGLSGIEMKTGRMLLKDEILVFASNKMEIMEYTIAHEIGHKIAMYINTNVICEEYKEIIKVIELLQEKYKYKNLYPKEVYKSKKSIALEIFADWYAYMTAENYRSNNRIKELIDEIDLVCPEIKLEDLLETCFKKIIETNIELYKNLSLYN